ncbi:hypothetical protein HBI67_215240 [Parastagonospora nodorum]|nr:hypothetical protein HBI47_206570 [Parastagonospora nodorum]KAH6050086.1 hypothetical protein HBI67_215240 [Parastagonospora nodorum]KAH6063069.1 hypothetical protein HBI66_178220 [Parastagonospora nodorum]
MDSAIIPFEEFSTYLNTQKGLTRYNSKDEKRPDHPWFSLPKAEIDRLLKEFAQLIGDLLRGSPHNDKELQHLDRTANQLAHVARSPAVKVALLGAQGAGKSLMINALFDCDGLSLTGADGAACTSSITRYAAYPETQPGEYTKFFAEIKFLSAEKREALLQEHARSYYHYQHAEEDSDDEDVPRSKVSRTDGELERRLKDTAEDVFTTLFGSQDSFEDNWGPDLYRSGEFVRLCQLKCEEALRNEDVNSQGIALKIADDQHGLLKQLRPFITKVEGVACLWPLVDSICIRFSHDLLQANVEIVDLPGWGDVNLSRVRHAEQIKDTVDVEMILADTIRMASDDMVINSARAAVAHHGAGNVKLIATKIDSLNKNQLAQYGGQDYDQIQQLLQYVEEQEAELDEDDEDGADAKKRTLLNKYKIYLERLRKQKKIADRGRKITKDLATKLQGRSAQDIPQVYHASASEYMDWIRKAKISFLTQPAIPVVMTGIPAIREFLIALPAQQNMQDYDRHINTIIPAFIEKVRRTVSETDRDGGFIIIADDFDRLRQGFMTRLLSQAKLSFQKASDGSMSRLTKDVSTFKEQVEEVVTEEWCTLKAAAFNRTLKGHGNVPKGASQAKGLENGTNWNRDLATLLKPGFHRWSNAYNEYMKPMTPALCHALEQLHSKTTVLINNAAANLVTVEKSKRKWAPLRTKLQAKLLGLMEEIAKIKQRTLEWATMEFDCENNVIANITDNIFDEVFKSAPALKPANPNRKKQTKQYVEPKGKFQRRKLVAMFLEPDSHFVDQVVTLVQSQFDKIVKTTLDEHFAGIDALLTEFSTTIRAQAPIDYSVTAAGEVIRADVEKDIPKLEEKAEALRKMLPVCVKREDDPTLIPIDNTDVLSDEDNLVVIYEKMAKRKVAEANGTSGNKRIKKEPFSF